MGLNIDILEENMHKHSRFVLVFCLAIVTTFASGCVPLTAVPSPTETSVPLQTPTNTPTSLGIETPITATAISSEVLTATAVPELGWGVLFKYDFEKNYWSVGEHSYRIIADCPDTKYFGDTEMGMEFIVDENAMRWPLGAVIELSYDYIRVRYDGYDVYRGSFHPQEKSSIVFGYTYLSLEQANQAIKECKIYAILDEKVNVTLVPDDPKFWPLFWGYGRK